MRWITLSALHWLRVGGNPFSENYVTEKDILKLNAFLERPGGPDNFFLKLQTHTCTAKKTRNQYLFSSSRSIHLFFDLKSDFGGKFLSQRGSQERGLLKNYQKIDVEPRKLDKLI